MDNALLIGLSRQAALRNQLNVVANNLANMNTNGYKTQRLLFEEYLMPVAQARQFEQGDQEFSYVVDYGMASNFEHTSSSGFSSLRPAKYTETFDGLVLRPGDLYLGAER